MTYRRAYVRLNLFFFEMPSKTFKSNENCSPEFLDAGQYQKNGILRYERIFGETFVSTGGEKTTKNFVSKIRLSPGMRVLDIGCGTGGSAFYMAKKLWSGGSWGRPITKHAGYR